MKQGFSYTEVLSLHLDDVDDILSAAVSLRKQDTNSDNDEDEETTYVILGD